MYVNATRIYLLNVTNHKVLLLSPIHERYLRIINQIEHVGSSSVVSSSILIDFQLYN